ncbi:histidine phosphotransferase family protein [Rickettsiales bacterium LUAb2]
MKENFYLSSLLASKICHDLIGSSSSLSFSMDMLQEEQDELNHDALHLASKSAAILMNRLKYFRVAFGISSFGNEELVINKVKELIFELSKEKDIYINWSESYDKTLNKALNNINIKLLLNIFLQIFHAIPKSANISFIAADIDQEKIGIMLTVKGYKIYLSEEVKQILQGKATLEDINPRNIDTYFTYFLKQETNSIIQISNETEELKVAFSLYKVNT